MSFVTGFYNFTIELNHTDREVFTRFRVKTARHPNESLEYLYARVIAFAHSYRDGQTFSQGLFEPKEPTIWRRDITGEIDLWVQVGAPERKKLEIALRSGPSVEYLVYFYEAAQIPLFCHYLRGSKTNWVKDISFFEIPTSLLTALAPFESSSPEWSITFVDNQLYLVLDGREFEAPIRHVDIWSEFQSSLSSEEGAY